MYIALACLSSIAIAQTTTSTATGTATATNNDNVTIESGGAAGNGGQGGQGGTSSANGGNASSSSRGGSASAQGASSNTNVSSSYSSPRQAPDVFLSNPMPSAPCRVTSGIGASGPMGGLSFGSSKLDNECDLRETARSFAALGNKLAAARILCNTKAAKTAQLTYQECANYANNYFGGIQDGDGPGYTVPEGTGTIKGTVIVQ